MASNRYVIRGRPVSKKNSRPIRLNKKTGKRFIGNNEMYLEWANDAAYQLRDQRIVFGAVTLKVRLHADVAIYLAKGQTMDIDNALCAGFDALQASGVIKNDAQIKSCTAKMGRDGGNPRVEIVLTELI